MSGASCSKASAVMPYCLVHRRTRATACTSRHPVATTSSRRRLCLAMCQSSIGSSPACANKSCSCRPLLPTSQRMTNACTPTRPDASTGCNTAGAPCAGAADNAAAICCLRSNEGWRSYCSSRSVEVRTRVTVTRGGQRRRDSSAPSGSRLRCATHNDLEATLSQTRFGPDRDHLNR